MRICRLHAPATPLPLQQPLTTCVWAPVRLAAPATGKEPDTRREDSEQSKGNTYRMCQHTMAKKPARRHLILYTRGAWTVCPSDSPNTPLSQNPTTLQQQSCKPVSVGASRPSYPCAEPIQHPVPSLPRHHTLPKASQVEAGASQHTLATPGAVQAEGRIQTLLHQRQQRKRSAKGTEQQAGCHSHTCCAVHLHSSSRDRLPANAPLKARQESTIRTDKLAIAPTPHMPPPTKPADRSGCNNSRLLLLHHAAVLLATSTALPSPPPLLPPAAAGKNGRWRAARWGTAKGRPSC